MGGPVTLAARLLRRRYTIAQTIAALIVGLAVAGLGTYLVLVGLGALPAGPCPFAVVIGLAILALLGLLVELLALASTCEIDEREPPDSASEQRGRQWIG